MPLFFASALWHRTNNVQTCAHLRNLGLCTVKLVHNMYFNQEPQDTSYLLPASLLQPSSLSALVLKTFYKNKASFGAFHLHRLHTLGGHCPTLLLWSGHVSVSGVISLLLGLSSLRCSSCLIFEERQQSIKPVMWHKAILPIGNIDKPLLFQRLWQLLLINFNSSCVCKITQKFEALSPLLVLTLIFFKVDNFW